MREMNSEYITLMKTIYSRFEAVTNEEARETLATKVIEIYDQIDRYLLSEQEDELVYEMYSRVRSYLWEDEIEFFPLLF